MDGICRLDRIRERISQGSSYGSLFYDAKFLLEQYEEERAAHNSHMTEICRLENENKKLLETLGKSRRLADRWEKSTSYLADEVRAMRGTIRSLTSLIEKHKNECDYRGNANQIYRKALREIGTRDEVLCSIIANNALWEVERMQESYLDK